MQLKVYIVFSYFFLLFFHCTPPESRQTQFPDEGKLTPKNNHSIAPAVRAVKTVSPSDDTVEPRPPLSPPQWIGKKFFILPKHEIVCARGYSITTCKKNECDTLQADPQWETSKHHVRCEKIRGESLYVETVEPDNGEWWVTFFLIPSEKRLYARTRKQAINEIAFSDDLPAAKKRWMGAYVFSKRGTVSIKGSSPGAAITSKRISIQDSLLVTDVRWGITPLPVKPLWLMVKLEDGDSGFIPVRYSWTNTMADQIADRQPWDEDIYETSPSVLFNWDENMWETVNNHRVVLEMTADQVLASWGYPLKTAPLPEDRTNGAIWTYPSHKLQFRYGKLISLSERQPPSE